MKYIFTLLSLALIIGCASKKQTVTEEPVKETTTTINTENLPTWTVYVLGKPYMPYWQARKDVAKRWGIPYELSFGGCVISEKTDAKSKAIDESNKAAFKAYAETFGADWQERFEAEADAIVQAGKN